MSDTIQLVYVSYSTDDFDTEKDIDLILDSSRKNNPILDITGMLLSNAVVFVQLLEGPENQVRALYEKIKKDKRHDHTFILVDQVLTGPRLFGDWSMGFKRLNDIDLETINTIFALHKKGKKNAEHQVTQEQILNLLKEFRFLVGQKAS